MLFNHLTYGFDSQYMMSLQVGVGGPLREIFHGSCLLHGLGGNSIQQSWTSLLYVLFTHCMSVQWNISISTVSNCKCSYVCVCREWGYLDTKIVCFATKIVSTVPAHTECVPLNWSIWRLLRDVYSFLDLHTFSFSWPLLQCRGGLDSSLFDSVNLKRPLQ